MKTGTSRSLVIAPLRLRHKHTRSKLQLTNERTGGWLLVALQDLHVLRKKLLKHPDVVDNKLRGSILYKTLIKEALNNSHRAVYDTILATAQAFRQPKTMTLEAALEHLDSLWASVSDDQQPTDGVKKRQLKVSLLPNFAAEVKLIDRTHPEYDYNELCAELTASFEEDEATRALAKSQHENEDAHLVRDVAAAPAPAAEANFADGPGYKRDRRSYRSDDSYDDDARSDTSSTSSRSYSSSRSRFPGR